MLMAKVDLHVPIGLVDGALQIGQGLCLQAHVDLDVLQGGGKA